MCHDLKPIADRSEVMCYDLKRLKFGLFVTFHDLSPITRGEKVVGYGLEGLKIGKKVMYHDPKPIADRSEVIYYDFEPIADRSKMMFHDFEPITDRVEVMSHHFEAVANRSERMVKTLVILPKTMLSRLGIFDASLPQGRACAVRKSLMRRRPVPFQKLNC